MKHTLFIVAAFAIFSFASCNNMGNGEGNKTDSTAAKTESKAEKNKKTIMKGMDAMASSHDANKVLADAAPDFMEYQDGTTPPIKGDTAKMGLQSYLNSFPDMKMENSMYFADDHNVVVVSDYTMTFKNDLVIPGMPPIKATGKTAKVKDVDIFTINDNGKVASHRSIYPSGALFMQLGVDMSQLQPPPPAGDKKKEEKKK